MFNDWKREKATQALIDAAQDLADKLHSAKPHVIDAHAAAAQFWAVSHLAEGQDLRTLPQWPPEAIRRFVTRTTATMATLRKARAYDSSDGLSVWLHSARAVAEPRIAPAVASLWQALAAAGPNAAAMADDLLAEAGLPTGATRITPKGLAPAP